MTSSMMRIVVLLVALIQGTSAMNVFNGFSDGIFPLTPTFAKFPILCQNDAVDAPWWLCYDSMPGSETTTTETATARESTPAKKSGPKRTRKLHHSVGHHQKEKAPKATKKITRKRKLRGQ